MIKKLLDESKSFLNEDSPTDGMRTDLDGNKRWYQNGTLHRVDGPAVEYAGRVSSTVMTDPLLSTPTAARNGTRMGSAIVTMGQPLSTLMVLRYDARTVSSCVVML